MFKCEWIYKSRFYYLIPYILLNIGFIIPYFLKFESILIDVFSIIFFICLFILIIMDLIIYFPRISDEGLTSEKRDSFNRLLNKIGIDGFKRIFVIITTILPLISGYAIKYDSNISIIISKMALSLGLIIYYSCIIKYHYISIDSDKLDFSNSLLLILAIFLFITILYPDVFSDFLKKLPENLLNIAVTSLTFVLLTATLALLVFTYDMLLEIGDHLHCGKYYFKSTLYAIFSSIILFVLFIVLVLFKDFVNNLDY